MVHGIDDVPEYSSPIAVAKLSSNIALYSKKMSESFYVSMLHKITVSKELRPCRYKGCLKNSKLLSIAKLLPKVFLTA